MIRGIVTVVLLVALVVGCVWLYRRASGDSSLGTGDVYTRTPDKDRMETGASYLDGKPVEEAHPTPSRSDAPGTINTEPVATYDTQNNPPPTTNTQPGYTPSNNVSIMTPSTSQTTQPGYRPEGPIQPSYTIAPNPPSGMAFAGTGKFQWYRQGDLTWRLDTVSGVSCVDYATMDQWRNPIVYSHGCGAQRWGRRRRFERAEATLQ